MRYEIRETQGVPGEWRAEAIDYADDGKCYVVIFSGPHAKIRTEEYAALKNVGM